MAIRIGLAALAALAAAGCGGAEEKAADAPVNERSTVGEALASGMPAGFNATDACALLDKDIVERTLGSTVSATKLEGVVQPTDGTAGFSYCVYELADGRKPSFFTRWSPIVDSDAAGIAKTRAGIAELSKISPVDVPEVGTGSFWVGGMNQLHIFPAKDRYVFFTFLGQDEATAKADAIKLAKAAGY